MAGMTKQIFTKLRIGIPHTALIWTKSQEFTIKDLYDPNLKEFGLETAFSNACCVYLNIQI